MVNNGTYYNVKLSHEAFYPHYTLQLNLSVYAIKVHGVELQLCSFITLAKSSRYLLKSWLGTHRRPWEAAKRSFIFCPGRQSNRDRSVVQPNLQIYS
jgi:hypothetical protein